MHAGGPRVGESALQLLVKVLWERRLLAEGDTILECMQWVPEQLWSLLLKAGDPPQGALYLSVNAWPHSCFSPVCRRDAAQRPTARQLYQLLMG